METVYIETTVVSLLVARPSRDSVMAAHQQITRRWWQDRRLRFHCVTFEEVIREASQGDPEMSLLRLEALAVLPVLPVTETARGLAKEILQKGLLPPQAVSDAIHAAVASTESIETLLIWELPAFGQSRHSQVTAGFYECARPPATRGLHPHRT